MSNTTNKSIFSLLLLGEGQDVTSRWDERPLRDDVCAKIKSFIKQGEEKFLKDVLKYWILVVLVCIGSILAPAAQAQVDLGIYPPVMKIDLTPPLAITTPFSIQNYSSDPIELEIHLKPFQSSSEYNGTVQLLPKSSFSQISQKIKILDDDQPINQIILAPQEEKQLNLQINLSKAESSGDYYFSILFLSKPQGVNQNAKTMSAIRTGIGTNVLLSIGPKDPTTGLLAQFSTHLYVNHGPVPFRVLIENTSKHLIVPKGNILIRNIFGQVVGKLDVKAVTILANTKRYIPDASSNSAIEAVWNEKVLLGPYTAEITTTLSDNGPILKKTVSFFAFPIEYIIALVLACLMIASLVWKVKTKLKNS